MNDFTKTLIAGILAAVIGGLILSYILSDEFIGWTTNLILMIIISGLVLIIFLSKSFRDWIISTFIKTLANWTSKLISNWEIILIYLILFVIPFFVFYQSNSLLIASSVFIALFLTMISSKRHFRKSPKQKTGTKKIAVKLSPTGYQKSWEHMEIKEWVQPVVGFKTIYLSTALQIMNTYPGRWMEFQKPLFGINRIPFELNFQHPNNGLMGVELNVRKNEKRSREITPGEKNVSRVHMLITAGSAHRISENFELNGLTIGQIEFHTEQGQVYKLPLTLGKNIRDWSFRHPDVVQTITNENIEQVWTDEKDEVTIDLIHFTFPDGPVDIAYCQLATEINTLPDTYQGVHPTIRLSGLTYSIKSLDRTKKNSDQTISPLDKFSERLDNLTKMKKISGLGKAFLRKIKTAPPFMGFQHSNPALPLIIERNLTEYFSARNFRALSKKNIRGGENYTVKNKDTWKSIAKNIYRSIKHADSIREANKGASRLIAGMVIHLPYIDTKNPLEMSSKQIEKKYAIAEEGWIEPTKQELIKQFNLLEDEALPLLEMVYVAAIEAI